MSVRPPPTVERGRDLGRSLTDVTVGSRAAVFGTGTSPTRWTATWVGHRRDPVDRRPRGPGPPGDVTAAAAVPGCRATSTRALVCHRRPPRPRSPGTAARVRVLPFPPAPVGPAGLPGSRRIPSRPTPSVAGSVAFGGHPDHRASQAARPVHRLSVGRRNGGPPTGRRDPRGGYPYRPWACAPGYVRSSWGDAPRLRTLRGPPDPRRAGRLKEKRGTVKHLVEACRARFGVAAAEVGYQDQWQRSELGFAAVSGTPGQVESVLDPVERFVWSHSRGGGRRLVAGLARVGPARAAAGLRRCRSLAP